MNIDRLHARIKDNEGFSKTVYKDSLGIDTVGYGFTMKDLVLPEGISSTLLRLLIQSRVIELHDRLSWFSDMPGNVQEVVTEMTYQMGVGGFLKFKKTIAYLKSRKWKKAAKEMLDSKWARSDSPKRAKRLSVIITETK